MGCRLLDCKDHQRAAQYGLGVTVKLIDAADRATSPSAMRLLGAVTAGAGAMLTLGSDDGVVLCPYRRCTGGDCPFCGVTRASARLVQGDLAGSVALHPMVVLWALQIPLWTAVARRADRSSSNQRAWWQQHGSTVLLSNVTAAALVWLVRLGLGDVAPPAELTLPW